MAYHSTPDKDNVMSRNKDNEPSRRGVNKMLSFEVDLCDDKTEERSEKECADAMDTSEEKSSSENYEDEDVEATNTSLCGHKRKRVITSDNDDSHEPVSEKSDAILDDESDVEKAMSRRRDKKPKMPIWPYVAEMVAEFRKDLELCMSAICVLYRFQTEYEKQSRSTFLNGRGFNMDHAERGTLIGEFLTDGDPHGDLKKSVEELTSFQFGDLKKSVEQLTSFQSDPVEFCRDLANYYSKQLFQIYEKREDPFFTLPPSP